MSMARAAGMKSISRERKKLRLAAGDLGINYSGLKIPKPKGHGRGTEQPIFYWKKSPAISGMAFYNAMSSRSGKTNSLSVR
jgi:hypothetical protein